MDDQEEIINKLTERIRAEQATAAELKRQNDLAEKTLRQAQTSERIRQAFWSDISEKTAGLVGKLPELELLLHGLAEKLDEFGEQLRDVGKRQDRLELGLMLLLSGKGNGNRDKTRALIEDIEKDRKARLIEEHKRMLHELEMKRAGYGRLSAPSHILMEIEDLKSEIEQLEESDK
jgi:hypothetical protein